MSGIRNAVSPHPVRKYVERVASLDIEEYPEWDLKRPLPKLPVPDLQCTLEKYLLCIKPLVSQEQYEHTRHLVEKFGARGGQGEKLQKTLLEFAETQENWAVNYWFDDMYMKLRLALPLNSNPGMVFPRQHFEDRSAQLRFAARLISGILDYKTIIDSRSLPVDRCRHNRKGQPLCMEQYYRLFSSYRVPGVERDHLLCSSSSSMSSSSSDAVKKRLNDPAHVMVACRNQLFVLDVVVNGSRLSDDNLYCQLKRVVKQAEEEQAQAAKIGILTGCDRDTWARARINLLQNDENRRNLYQIEQCIFVLCLDKSLPLSFNHPQTSGTGELPLRDDVSLANQMLHGMGSSHSTPNRWFDKTMQFIIGEDGACGLCYEHSPSEGIAVVQLIEHLLKYMEEIRVRGLRRLQSLCELPQPQKLYWHVDQHTQAFLDKACVEVDRMIDDLDLYVLRFNRFGKEFPKKQNMSPDAFIQLALQLTYYKVNHCLVSTYESAAIRRFRLGRVDNIRACTIEALEWVKAMVGETEATDEQKMALLRKAMNKQTSILLQTILGAGIDNHLLGLKETALSLHMDEPDLFTDHSYKVCNHFTLSTSQVPTSTDSFMLYGPVVPNGYGACYNPHPDYILVCISSFKSSEQTSSDHFAFTLESALMQMQELCLNLSGQSQQQQQQQPKQRQGSNGSAASSHLIPNGHAKPGVTTKVTSNQLQVSMT